MIELITQSVSSSHLEEFTEDPVTILRVCSVFGYNPEGVVRISLILVREGLTDEMCLLRSERLLRNEAADASHDTFDLFG